MKYLNCRYRKTLKIVNLEIYWHLLILPKYLHRCLLINMTPAAARGESREISHKTPTGTWWNYFFHRKLVVATTVRLLNRWSTPSRVLFLDTKKYNWWLIRECFRQLLCSDGKQIISVQMITIYLSHSDDVVGKLRKEPG